MEEDNVARTGDIIATPGTTLFTGANSGSWTAGTISVQTYSKLTIGGQPVIFGASCTFNFTGTMGNGAPITGIEAVTLTAGATVLQKGQAGVLVQGNSHTGEFGNTLEVQTANKLTTA